MNNPYDAPAADLSHGGPATYDPEVLSVSGRIGRCRYLAYSMALMFLLMVVGMTIGLFAGMSKSESSVGAVLLPMLISALAISFIMGKRRLNDMNHSGWLSLLLLVPLVNFFVGLWLTFGPGDTDANKYGPPSSKNSGLVIAGVWVLTTVFVLGVLASVGLPALQDYLIRSVLSNAHTN